MSLRNYDDGARGALRSVRQLMAQVAQNWGSEPDTRAAALAELERLISRYEVLDGLVTIVDERTRRHAGVVADHIDAEETTPVPAVPMAALVFGGNGS